MANVVTLKNEENNPQEKLESFMTRHRGLILGLACVLIVVALAACIVVGVLDSQRKNGLNQLDSIVFTYTQQDSAETQTDEMIVAKQTAALEALKPFLSKKNVVGVRANLIAADISYAKKDFTNSMDYFLAAAKLGGKVYTTPVQYFNAASCCEELGNNTDAAKYYKLAADDKDFPLRSHALFNLGRVKEALDDLPGAAETYKQLADEFKGNEWASVAQTRLIQLKAAGKISE